jgi:hypothetical protein
MRRGPFRALAAQHERGEEAEEASCCEFESAARAEARWSGPRQRCGSATPTFGARAVAAASPTWELRLHAAALYSRICRTARCACGVE